MKRITEVEKKQQKNKVLFLTQHHRNATRHTTTYNKYKQ